MTRKRAIWMDVVRGLAIIAVIYGHVENVAKIEAVFEREDWMVTTNMTLVLLRMPMLMFLSGMLVPRSIAKGWKMFLPGKFTKLAWPYAVWIAIFFTVVWIRGGAELSQIPMEIINPENPNMTPLWYLRNLFFYYLIAQALTWLRLPLWSGAALGFGICVYQVIDNPQIDTTPLRWGYLMTFFFLGCLTMQHLDKISRFCRKPVVTLLLAVAFVIPVYIYLQGIAPVRYRPEFIWGPIAFICLILAFAPLLKSSRYTKPLQFIGRYSLYYYVMHYPIFLVYAWWIAPHVEIGTAHYPVMMAIGLIIPTLTVYACQKVPALRWIFFELPWPRKKASAR